MAVSRFTQYTMRNTPPESPAMAQILTHHLSPVGSHPVAASPYGDEVSGNVWEWTVDWYKSYEGNTHKDRDHGEKHKVLRGGSWVEVRDETVNRYFRCVNRLHAPPDYAASNIGFRYVKAVTPQEAQAYAPQISVALLTKYVKQERWRNLSVVLKRAQVRCLQDSLIALSTIGTASYGTSIPQFAIGGFTLEMIGVGFLFSAGVNFWRQWKARNSLARERLERSDE